MVRDYNIRFNKTEPTSSDKWVVEDSITHQFWTAEEIHIQVPTRTHNELNRTLYSIRATGILVWEDRIAIIK